jgi:hypothetical protein
MQHRINYSHDGAELDVKKFDGLVTPELDPRITSAATTVSSRS